MTLGLFTLLTCHIIIRFTFPAVRGGARQFYSQANEKPETLEWYLCAFALSYGGKYAVP